MHRPVTLVLLALVASCSAGSDSNSDVDVGDTPEPTAEVSADDTESSTPAAESEARGLDDPELCDALGTIVALNDRMGLVTQPVDAALIEDGAEASIAEEARAVASEMKLVGDEIDEAYVVAIDAASGERREDLETLATTTSLLEGPLIDVFERATDGADLADLANIFDDPELADAAIAGGNAALRIDEYAIPICGFRFSNS